MATTTRISPAARATPQAPPRAASTRLSTSSCRAISARDAPSAVRTVISRWRAVPRASSRLATLAQAISSTKPTAPSSSQRELVVPRLRKLLRNGSTLTVQPWFDAGYARAIRAAIAARLALACSTVTPSLSRPRT